MSIETDITVRGGAWDDSADLQTLADKIVAQVFAHLKMPDVTSELSVLLTDDAEIQEINAQWRGQDKPTNVLSFPAVQMAVGAKPGVMLGDIIIAYETLAREAAIENKSFHDHFTHLFVHGLLHLLGYDHENDDDAALMEKQETDILQTLGVDDPYAADTHLSEVEDS
ncbi:MAG: rRNA maturation RNase YbeY [Ahrensia sp.]|nr:rRNA maturation RNase YbeY [Ahrensia sp.]